MLRDRLVTLVARLLSVLFPQHAPPRTAARILILKPCCLGDVILATPVIGAMRMAYPHAQIDFAVGAWSRSVVAHHPHVHAILDTGAVGQGRYGWSDLRQLAERVRAGRYDLCLTLDRSPRVSVVPWLAGVPLRAGLDSRGRGFAHNIRVPVPAVRYEPELYLDVARAVTGQSPHRRPDVERPLFVPTAEERAKAAQVLAQAGALVVAVHPGGGSNPGTVLTAKRWAPERFAQVANRIAGRYGATVALVGTRSDAPLTAAVRGAMRAPSLDLTGQLDLGELGALYERCALMLGNDTGAMHLANAVGTPVVALYGPSDPRVYGPYDQKSLALWHDVGCNPCFRDGRARPDCCPNRSMEAIGVDEVWEAVQIVLRRQGVGPAAPQAQDDSRAKWNHA